MGTRQYESPARRAEAARTRSYILDAVAELCATAGYQATTLKAIAARAGVSVQSVSLAGTKASLLVAAYERAFSGTEGSESLSERPEMAAIMAEADTRIAIGRWLDYVAQANTRTAALYQALVIAAQLDPVAAEALADLNQRRSSDMELAAGWLVHRGLMPPPRNTRVADEIGLIVGPEAFAYLVTDRGWDLASYRLWMQEALPIKLIRSTT